MRVPSTSAFKDVILCRIMNPSKIIVVLLGIITAIALAIVLKLSQAVILPLQLPLHRFGKPVYFYAGR